MKPFIVWLLSICALISGCKHTTTPIPRNSIARDPTWYPLELGNYTTNINGFTNALIQEMAKINAIGTLIDVNSNALFKGLEEDSYGGVLSSLSLLVQSEAEYDFSEPFLCLGPVLVVPDGSTATSLEEMREKIIGVNAFDNSVLIVQKYPSIVIRLYQNIPVVYDDILAGKIDGALVSNIEAHTIIPKRYAGQLKIVTPPLDDLGLRLVTLKNQNSSLITEFNNSLEFLRTTGRYEELRKEFSLP